MTARRHRCGTGGPGLCAGRACSGPAVCGSFPTAGALLVGRGASAYNHTAMNAASVRAVDRAIERLQSELPAGAVLTDWRDLAVYSYDATLERRRPEAVVLPETAQQVQAAVRICTELGVPLVPRGSGTCLSGGPVPVRGSIVLSLTRMDRIVEVDEENLRAVVEPGVINADLNAAVEERGLMYAPDPASQVACSIGGNVAENAGGPHCLKYGVTANHVLGLRAVLADGRLVRYGGKSLRYPSLDLRGMLIGSEGTLGVVVEITCRLLPKPPDVVTLLACFGNVVSAGAAVSDIIAAGILPATIEMIDRLVIEAVQRYRDLGYPRDAQAVLVIELDGIGPALRAQVAQIERICQARGALRFEWAEDPAERERLWFGRKGATAALSVIAPGKLSTDVTVPRERLPEALAAIDEISRRFNIPIGNVFHAGDGNLHPQVIFDPRDQEQTARAMAADEAITEMALKLGGVVTGEHGIGSQKRKWMTRSFTRPTLQAMWHVKDSFDPQGLLNPGKVLPDKSELAAAHSASAPAAASDRPQSPEELAALLRDAAADGRPVNAPGQSGMSTPAGGLEIDLTALSGIVDHDRENLTITVLGGTPLGEVRAALEGAGQCIPSWDGLGDDIPVGDVVARALPAPGIAAFGDARDAVLGLWAASGEGELIQAGSKCVKNVAGYALERLFVGGFSTLAVIAAVTLRVRAKPQAAASAEFRGPASAAAALALEAMRTYLPGLVLEMWPIGDAVAVRASLRGLREEVDWAVAWLNRAASAHGLDQASDVHPPDASGAALWAADPARVAQAAESADAMLAWPQAGLAFFRRGAQPGEGFQRLPATAAELWQACAGDSVCARLKEKFDPNGILPPWHGRPIGSSQEPQGK